MLCRPSWDGSDCTDAPEPFPPKLEKLVIVFAGVTLSIQTHVDSGHGGIKPCLFSTMTRPQVRKVLRSEKVRLSVRHRYTDDSAHDAKVNDQQGKPCL